MNTMTGKSPSGWEGAQTLRLRQSSLTEGNEPNCGFADGNCGHGDPKADASRGSNQGACGAGARQRKEPTGGSAYGIPRNEEIWPSDRPTTNPDRVAARAGRLPPSPPSAAASATESPFAAILCDVLPSLGSAGTSPLEQAPTNVAAHKSTPLINRSEDPKRAAI
jgi:hypothetical protein